VALPTPPGLWQGWLLHHTAQRKEPKFLLGNVRPVAPWSVACLMEKPEATGVTRGYGGRPKAVPANISPYCDKPVREAGSITLEEG